MSNSDLKVRPVDDPRIEGYTRRTRNGSTQVFYTGDDSRDFDRYRAEGGNQKPDVKMHDKPDTINIIPEASHYYADLIDGVWWWVNGCAECNGRSRDWMTYVECDAHNVCRSCQCSRASLTATPWGGKNGWQCTPCADREHGEIKQAALLKAQADGVDHFYEDRVVCPHCGNGHNSDEGHDDDGVTVCGVCDGHFTTEVDISYAYTTTIVGSRVLPKT